FPVSAIVSPTLCAARTFASRSSRREKREPVTRLDLALSIEAVFPRRGLLAGLPGVALELSFRLAAAARRGRRLVGEIPAILRRVLSRDPGLPGDRAVRRLRRRALFARRGRADLSHSADDSCDRGWTAGEARQVALGRSLGRFSKRPERDDLCPSAAGRDRHGNRD